MDVSYDVSGNMPVATGVSLLLHGMLAIAISTTLISSTLAPQSMAVTVTLTQSNEAPTDSQHIASENQLPRPGELLDRVREQRASARLAMMKTEALESLNAADIAAEVERLQGELSQVQQDQTQSTRLGSVAARRALDADYLRKWVNRVQTMGNAALNNVGSAQGDVRLLVVVDQFGILLEAIVLESSGFPHLDRAAIKTVQDAAPYPPFPPALSAQVDKLEIVRTWQFRP
ncbi:MAG: TonB family protein [Gammaproteobacteria bacterium]|nr:TonB family protein [Gammaproteobacteria bacterium]